MLSAVNSINNIVRSQTASNTMQAAQTIQGLIPNNNSANNTNPTTQTINQHNQLSDDQKLQLLKELEEKQDLTKQTKRNIAIVAGVTLLTAGFGIATLGSFHKKNILNEYKKHLKIEGINNFDKVFNQYNNELRINNNQRQIAFVPVKENNQISWYAVTRRPYASNTILHKQGQIFKLTNNSHIERIAIDDPSYIEQIGPPVFLDKSGNLQIVNGSFGLGFHAVGNLGKEYNLANKQGIKAKFSSSTDPSPFQGGFLDWLNIFVMGDIALDGLAALGHLFI